MAGLTDQGFVARRQPEILALLERRLSEDEELQGLNVRAGPIQNLLGILSEEIAETWEAMEAVYGAAYPGAVGVSLDAVAALTGTTRRPATRSTVVEDCTLQAATTLPAGSVVARAGSPDVQFRSVSEVTAGSDGTFGVTFEAVEPGAIAAPAGTLTVIVTPVSGWTAATNAADATIGRERAEDPELREQRRIELAGSGRSALAAIRAAVARVEGDSPDEQPVREVRVYENVTSATIGSRPAKSIEAVLWDGVAEDADDDRIAQAVWDSKGAGILAHGSESGTAVDADTGQEHTVAFTRATAVRLYIDAVVILVQGAALAWADNAREDLAEYAQDNSRVGRTVYASELICALRARPEVEAVVSLAIGTTPSPAASSVTIGETQIATLDTTDIDLAEAP